MMRKLKNFIIIFILAIVFSYSISLISVEYWILSIALLSFLKIYIEFSKLKETRRQTNLLFASKFQEIEQILTKMRSQINNNDQIIVDEIKKLKRK